MFLYSGRGYWNFPKGKIEGKENSIQTAFREVDEETGLGDKDLRILPSFKVYDRYFFVQDKSRISKLVIFFLAESSTPHVKISDEHEGYAWFSYREAMRVLKHKNTKFMLKRSYDFLRKEEKKDDDVIPAQAGI